MPTAHSWLSNRKEEVFKGSVHVGSFQGWSGQCRARKVGKEARKNRAKQLDIFMCACCLKIQTL